MKREAALVLAITVCVVASGWLFALLLNLLLTGGMP